MSLKRDVRMICAHGTLTHMLFLLPVIYPYYQSIGLGFKEFLIGEAVFSVMVILSEVPSGWISDTWKRRATLVLGGFFGLLGYSQLMVATDFYTATLAQGVIGIAVALNSGTNTALLYDRLHEEGKDSEYRRLDGHRHGISFYGTAMACVFGAVLFTVHPKLPLVFDLVALTGAMIAIVCVREPKRFMESTDKNLFRDLVDTMKYALTGQPEIAGIITVAAVIMCTTKLMVWVQQPYYLDAGLNVAWYGLILGGTFILGGIAGQLSHRFERFGSNRAALGAMAALLVVCCFTLAAFTSVWLGMVLFFSGTLVYAIGQPRINQGINSRIGPERRATVLSTASLMVHFLFIPTSVVVGEVTDRAGVSGGLMWMGAQLLVLGSIGLWLWGRNGKRYAANSTITGT